LEKRDRRIVNFLEDNKKYTGLSEYKILLSLKPSVRDDAYAELDVNILEKTLKIQLSKEFYLKNPIDQRNILFHELVHARVEVMKKLTEQFSEHLEEDFVNDLVRGFERFYGKKEWKIK